MLASLTDVQVVNKVFKALLAPVTPLPVMEQCENHILLYRKYDPCFAKYTHTTIHVHLLTLVLYCEIWCSSVLS